MYGPNHDDAVGCGVVLLVVAVLVIGLVADVAFRPGWDFWIASALPGVVGFFLGVIIGVKLKGMN